MKKVAECSYLVKTAQGHLLRRNRKFLRSGEMPEEATRPFGNEELQGQPELIQDSQLTQAQGETPYQQEETPQPPAAGSCQLDQSSSDTAGTPTKLGRTVKTPERYKDFVKL